MNEFEVLTIANWDGENLEKKLKSKLDFKSIGIKRTITNQIEIMKDTSLIVSNPYYHKQVPNLEIPNFEDKVFPPTKNSLCFIDKTKSVSACINEDDTKPLEGLIWLRASQICKGRYVVYEKLDIEDIHQGVLGNCYFLSSLSAIAENPNRLAKLIQNNGVSSNGCYAINVYIQGKKKTVVIDDYFPTFKNKNWAMASSGHGEIWVQLFEKLWAKLNTSYTMTIAGLPSEALSTLTEAPVITYVHKKYEPEELWLILKKCDDENYIICTTTSGQAGKEVGLVESHAYTVISVFDVDGFKLLKIRNPWGGGFEWNGDFGDKSKLWTPELKKKVKFSDVNDGIFYMTFNDFIKYYPYTFVCKYYDGWHYKFKKVRQTAIEHMVGLRFKVDKQTKAIFGLHQKQERFYHRVKNYKPCYSKVFLVRYHGNTYEFIKANEGSTDKIFLDLDSPLEPGEYYILGKVNWNYFNQDKCSLIFSAYSDNQKLDFHPLDRQAIRPDYLTKIFDSYIAKNCEYKYTNSDNKDGLSYVSSLKDTDTGFFWLSFKNNNPREACNVRFAVQLNEFITLLSKNVNIKNFNGNNLYTITIPPNGQELVLFEQQDNVWLCRIALSSLEVTWDGGQYDPEVDKSYIQQNLSKITKDRETLVENDVFLSEIVKDSSLLYILQNDSNSDYMFKTSFVKNVNCSVAYPISTNVKIHPKSFEFFKVVPAMLDVIDFNFVYSYKNLSKDQNDSVAATKEKI